MSSPHPPSGRRWALVLEHRERLQRLVRARLPEPRDVEDVVHEALIRAACFADLDETRVGALLTTTALRLCADTHRTRSRQQRLLGRVGAAAAVPGPEEIVCDRQLGRWLMEHVQQLPGRERQVLLARASGLSTTEAASRFQISAKAAECAFTRGRARLRRLHELDNPPSGMCTTGR